MRKLTLLLSTALLFSCGKTEKVEGVKGPRGEPGDKGKDGEDGKPGEPPVIHYTPVPIPTVTVTPIPTVTVTAAPSPVYSPISPFPPGYPVPPFPPPPPIIIIDQPWPDCNSGRDNRCQSTDIVVCACIDTYWKTIAINQNYRNTLRIKNDGPCYTGPLQSHDYWNSDCWGQPKPQPKPQPDRC